MAVESVTARTGFVDDMQGMIGSFEFTDHFVNGFQVARDGSIAPEFRGVIRRQGNVNGVLMDVETYKHGRTKHSSPPLCGSVLRSYNSSITHALKDGELLFCCGCSFSHYV